MSTAETPSLAYRKQIPAEAPEEVHRFTRGSYDGELRIRRFADGHIGSVAIVIKNDPETATLCEMLGASITLCLADGHTVKELAGLLDHNPRSIASFVLKMLETTDSPPESRGHRSTWPLVRS